MKPNFKFKIDKRPFVHSEGFKTNFIRRFIARLMCQIIYKDPSTHYQFGGWSGSLKKEYNTCLANKFQLMHWILYSVGYSCCVADIMERCGIDQEDKRFE
jgi:hypothetical protein